MNNIKYNHALEDRVEKGGSKMSQVYSMSLMEGIKKKIKKLKK
ncbi:MAG: hypothetical protein RLN62_04920 [Rickettsiales bacterium]